MSTLNRLDPLRIVFDENIPHTLMRWLPAHRIETPVQRGWAALENGLLIAAAEQAGFDLIVTADQNIAYQQNLSKRRIALLVLGSNRWSLLEPHLLQIISAVESSHPNSFVFVEIPLPPKPHRSS